MKWSDFEGIPAQIIQTLGDKYGDPQADENEVFEMVCKALPKPVPVVDLLPSQVNTDLVRIYGLRNCLEFRFLPLFRSGITLVVATCCPWAGQLVTRIRELNYDRVRLVAVAPGRFEEAYRVQEARLKLLKAKAPAAPRPAISENSEEEITAVALIEKAHNLGASDIHIEPLSDRLVIRFRINGEMVVQDPLEGEKTYALIDRIKDLASLPTSERSRLRSGRFTARFGDKSIDLRLEKAPVQGNKETLVLRLLDPENIARHAGTLPFPAHLRSVFLDALHSESGLIIMTGPTGSGKTTTLYQSLTSLDLSRLKVLTIEDPIEYPLEKVVQHQTNADNDVTFATAMRSFLRMDPDVIMVGEIRDEETARLAVTASNSGHLVLTTLHTNDAVGVVPRLIDLGLTAADVQRTLSLAVAQRLLPTLCPHCRYPVPLTPGQVRHFEHYKLQVPDVLYRSTGCEQCNNVGISGRKAIFEFFKMTDGIRNMLLKEFDLFKLIEENRKAFPPLVVSALREIGYGSTPYSAVADYEPAMSRFLD